MLLETQHAVRVARSANADTGTAAEGRAVLLRRTLDQQGKIVRENDDFIKFLSTQSSTKEVPNGVRTLLRVDRSSNGDIPAASAYVVIVSEDTTNGRDSGVSALVTLLSCILGRDTSVAWGTDEPSINIDSTPVILETEYLAHLARYLRGEV